MERLADRLVAFAFMFVALFGLGALLRTACSDWTWSLNALMSAVCSFFIAAVCHD